MIVISFFCLSILCNKTQINTSIILQQIPFYIPHRFYHPNYDHDCLNCLYGVLYSQIILIKYIRYKNVKFSSIHKCPPIYIPLDIINICGHLKSDKGFINFFRVIQIASRIPKRYYM